jgi:hypothetical protein
MMPMVLMMSEAVGLERVRQGAIVRQPQAQIIPIAPPPHRRPHTKLLSCNQFFRRPG